MKQLFTILIIVLSLGTTAQDTTGKFSIKLTGPQIDFICKMIDSSDLPARIASQFKADIISQAMAQVKQPTKKEGKKD